MAWPVFLSGPGPGPGGSWPESGGELDGPGFADVFAAGPGGSVPGDEGTLLMRGAFDSIAVEPEALSQEPVTALRVVVFARDRDTGTRVRWADSAGLLDVLDIVNAYGSGPEWGDSGLDGIIQFPDLLGLIVLGPGSFSPWSEVLCIWPGLTCDAGPDSLMILPDISVLNVCYMIYMLDPVCLAGHVWGSVYCRWHDDLFTLDVLRICLDDTVGVSRGTAIGNNRLCDPLWICWITLVIWCDEWMEVMTLAGDAPDG